MKKLLATLGSLKRRSMQMVAVAGGLFTASVASAITAPAAGSFAYDLYDVGVNDVLLGAPGFVGGVIIMETVFNYPGVAKLMVDAVATRDLPLIQSCAMIFCFSYLFLVTLADIAGILSNPRLRT